jgi:chromate transporter
LAFVPLGGNSVGATVPASVAILVRCPPDSCGSSALGPTVTESAAVPADGSTSGPAYSLAQLIVYFLKLGTTGFGGPVALTGYMQRDLVERRRWITQAEYKDGLALAQLAPGPLAAQLAIYLGFVHYGVVGSTLVALAFVLPSFVMVVVGGWLYVTYAGLTWLQDVFYAVGAAVIGIIATSAYKLITRTIGRDFLLLAICASLAVYTAVTRTENVILFLAAGLLVVIVRTPPSRLRFRSSHAAGLWLTSLGALPRPVPSTDGSTLVDIALFFSKAGAFVFGSGLAIVPFLYGGVVEQFGWLNEQEFLDAVAVALITPGPVVITTGFIGFLVGGFVGAAIAAVATFLPCYLFTVVPAPWFRRHGKRPGIAAFVDGVTAAAIGAITGAVFVLGRGSVTDVPTALIALVTVGLLIRFGRRAPEPVIVAVAAALGLVIGAP